MRKVETEVQRALPRKRRLRKKLHLGEFQVLGCKIKAKFKCDQPIECYDDFDKPYFQVCDAVYDFCEDNDLELGMFGGCFKDGLVYTTIYICNIQMRESEVEMAIDFLKTLPKIVSISRNEMEDAWYYEDEERAHILVYTAELQD